MRWWLLGAVVICALAEGLIMSNWSVYGVKLPLTWLALSLILINEWAGWRQVLATAVVAGYCLDVIAAPRPGGSLLPILIAVLLAQAILNTYHYSNNAKIGALLSGSAVVSAGWLSLGWYWPGWAFASQLVIYWLVVGAAYWLAQSTALGWLKRL